MFPLRFIETLRCLNSERFQLYVVADPTGLVINVFHRVVVVLHFGNRTFFHPFRRHTQLRLRQNLKFHFIMFVVTRFNFAIYLICGRVPLLFL